MNTKCLVLFLALPSSAQAQGASSEGGVHLLVFAGLGYSHQDQFAPGGVSSTRDPEGQPGRLDLNDVSGAGPLLAGGVRASLARNIEVQSRLSVFLRPSAAGPCEIMGNRTACEYEVKMWALSLDGSLRTRPLGTASPWWVGLGLWFSILQMSGSVDYVEESYGDYGEKLSVPKSSDFSGSGYSGLNPLTEILGETGLLLGAEQEWEVSVRGAFGAEVRGGDLAGDLQLALGRALL